MKGFVKNIENITEENNNYRQVLYTSKNSQLVVMCIMPGDEIGLETHELDQFIRIEEGTGKVIIDGNEYEVSDGFGIVIPEGAEHNVINTGNEPLKLYSIYSPAEHKDGTIHPTKADDKEEHFDGVTTE